MLSGQGVGPSSQGASKPWEARGTGRHTAVKVFRHAGLLHAQRGAVRACGSSDLLQAWVAAPLYADHPVAGVPSGCAGSTAHDRWVHGLLHRASWSILLHQQHIHFVLGLCGSNGGSAAVEGAAARWKKRARAVHRALEGSGRSLTSSPHGCMHA